MGKDTLYEKYEFSELAVIRNGESRIHQFMDKQGINLFVNFDTGEFYMKWLIPNTIFKIECPKCSPISNVEHFEKMYKKFKLCVNIWEVA